MKARQCSKALRRPSMIAMLTLDRSKLCSICWSAFQEGDRFGLGSPEDLSRRSSLATLNKGNHAGKQACNQYVQAKGAQAAASEMGYCRNIGQIAGRYTRIGINSACSICRCTLRWNICGSVHAERAPTQNTGQATPLAHFCCACMLAAHFTARYCRSLRCHT